MSKRKKQTQNQDINNPEIENLEYKEKEKAPIASIKRELSKIKLNPRQVELLHKIETSEITIISGPAGTGKTWTSCYYAAKSIMEHKYERIILTKPIQESGEKLGFLPGSIDEKIDPYLQSFLDNFKEMVPATTYKNLMDKKRIIFEPLAYMRGRNFHNCLLLGDELQNADLKSLMLYVTRMGKNSKIIMSGDVSQYDINSNKVSLPFFIDNILKDVEGVSKFSFTNSDIVRNKILIQITENYEKLKAEDKIPNALK